MNISEDLMKVLLEQMKVIAKTETIVGEAFAAGGTTIIPVSRVSLGVGVGGGGSDGMKGNGGGGGIKVEPIAFLVVRGESVSLLNVGRGKGLDFLFEKAPDLVDKLVEKVSEGIKKRREGEEDSEHPTDGRTGSGQAE
ncbi:MAG TPA: spore germination protein GerW family protein [Nitrospiria bacterium]|nr:spore germination protein GerW family protein [Nitrospiria bacterium]